MFTEIMKYMKENKEATLDQISVSLGIERKDAELALSKLQNMGRIKKTRRTEQSSCSGCGMCSKTENKQKEIFIYSVSGRQQKQITAFKS